MALAKVAMHAREHIVLIRPTNDGLVLHTMYFVDELHKTKVGGKSSKPQFAGKEMDLAKRLIVTLASPFKPEQYKDDYKKNVERLIDQKRKGKTVTVVSQPKVKPGTDIMEALKLSLERKAAGHGAKTSHSGSANKSPHKRPRKAA